MSTASPSANTSVRKAIKRAIHNSGAYAPLLPVFRGLQNVISLSEALAWCRSQLKLQSGHPDGGMSLNDRCDLYEFLLKHYELNKVIDYLEFGVYLGASLKWWLKHNVCMDSRFYGFDTFTGLPENWGTVKKGYFSTNGQAPLTDDTRARFIKGLFQDTLDDFLRDYDGGRRKIVHIDADLYSSTLFVLTRLGPLLKRDDIIIFDEFLSWKNPSHEFQALRDFSTSYRVNCRLIAAADMFAHAAIQVF